MNIDEAIQLVFDRLSEPDLKRVDRQKIGTAKNKHSAGKIGLQRKLTLIEMYLPEYEIIIQINPKAGQNNTK